MPYSVTAYFDTESELRIHNLWKVLSEQGISEYLFKSENKPHIKLFMMDDADVAAVHTEIERICRTTDQVPIHFKNYGVYPNENPILFLDISANVQILALQKKVFSIFSSLPHQCGGNYFDAGIYKPDCFLTVSVEKERAIKGLELLLNEPLPFEGRIESLGLISFHPAIRLFEYRLKEQESGRSSGSPMDAAADFKMPT